MKKIIKRLLNLLIIAGVVMILATSCKKDNDTDDPTQSGTVKDIDGNVYTTVTIGTQVWMVENLKTTKYRNGSPIPNVSDNTAWRDLTTGAYCNYNNDEDIATKYGKLYNWHAVNDSRKIAPAGWHVPSDAEWTILEIYVAANLGTSGTIAKSLAAKTDWGLSDKAYRIGNNLTKNNYSGFSALPVGDRYTDGTFGDLGEAGYWWSSTEDDADDAYYRSLYYYSGKLGSYYDYKEYGFSVRCIKD